MADQKLSALTAREATVGDPFNDLLYYYVAAGATDADKQRKSTPFDLLIGCFRRMSFFFCDFHANEMGSYGNVGSSNQVDEQHQGIAQIFGTNASDVGGFRGAYRGVSTRGGAIRLVFVVKTLSDLSTAGDRYVTAFGIPSEGDSQLNQDGVYVRYSDNINAGKWQLVTRNAGAETAVDTGVTVAVDTWYRIQIDINADATAASASINGSSPVTATTNVYQNDATIGLTFLKVNGTNERGMAVDYVAFMKHLAGGR